MNDYEVHDWSVLANDPKLWGVHGIVLAPLLIIIFSMAFESLFPIVAPIGVIFILFMAYVQVRKKTTFAGFFSLLRQKVSGKYKPRITRFAKWIRDSE